MSCIKSIQRGTASGDQTISINEIDASKAVVIITPAVKFESPGGNSSNIRGVCSFTLTNTTLVIRDTSWKNQYDGAWYSGASTYTWQVIEFA